MFFYIDESGNTGRNLFDANQPNLYYGVLSSKLNIDLLCKKSFIKVKEELGIKKLHGKDLSQTKIINILPFMLELQKKYKIRFDFFRVVKPDHALISFFDQVFDQGNNPAYSWIGYWTPMRYVMLIKLASLFDEDTLKKAWAARIELNSQKAEKIVIEVCEIIQSRIEELPDQRSRQLINDTLQWAKKNYHKLHYNVIDKESLWQITPNLIGFQFVLHHIARQTLKNNKQATKITLDQQLEFNESQKAITQYYSDLRKANVVSSSGPGLPKEDYRNMPTIPLSISSGNFSIGLEIVDIYLWIYQRYFEEKKLSDPLLSLIEKNKNKTTFQEISLNGIISTANKWVSELPEFSVQELDAAKRSLAVREKLRIQSLKN